MKLTRSQIAVLLEVKENAIRTYLSRKKLVEVNGIIDTSEGINHAFIEEQMTKKGIEIPDSLFDKDEEVIESVHHSEQTEQPEVKQGDLSKKDYKDLSKAKLVSEIQKNQVAYEKGKLELSQKKGELIEVEAAKEISNRHSVGLKSGYRDMFKQVINDISSKHSIPHEEVVKIHKNVDEQLNQVDKDVFNVFKSEISDIVDEFKLKRGRGERK